MRTLKKLVLAAMLLSACQAWAEAMTGAQMEALAGRYMVANSQEKKSILNSHTAVEMANVLVLVDIKHQKWVAQLTDMLEKCIQDVRELRGQ